MGDNPLEHFGVYAPAMRLVEDPDQRKALEQDPVDLLDFGAYQVAAAIACEEPAWQTQIPNTCQEFEKKFPKGFPRQKLFDQRCSQGRQATPLDDIELKAPLALLHTTKSYRVFHDLADVLVKNFPGVLKKREINILYPASGAQITPFLTARALIERGVIDSAQIACTELNPDTGQNLYAAFLEVKKYAPGLFDTIKLSPNGQVVTVTFQGKEVVFKASIRDDSSEPACQGINVCGYFSKKEFQEADLILQHDADDVTYQVMLELQQKIGEGRSHLFLAEGFLEDSLTLAYGGKRISGPYGCSHERSEIIGKGSVDGATLLDLQQVAYLPDHQIKTSPKDSSYDYGSIEKNLASLKDNPEQQRRYAVALFGDYFSATAIINGTVPISFQKQMLALWRSTGLLGMDEKPNQNNLMSMGEVHDRKNRYLDRFKTQLQGNASCDQ